MKNVPSAIFFALALLFFQFGWLLVGGIFAALGLATADIRSYRVH